MISYMEEMEMIPFMAILIIQVRTMAEMIR